MGRNPSAETDPSTNRGTAPTTAGATTRRGEEASETQIKEQFLVKRRSGEKTKKNPEYFLVMWRGGG